MNDKDFIEELKRKRDEYGVTQTRLAVSDFMSCHQIAHIS